MQPAAKLGIAAAAVVLLGVGAWYSGSGSSPAVAPPNAAPSSTRPQSANRPLAPTGGLEPVKLAAADDRPDASAPPLEDTIERAMPAIVMVQTPVSRGSGFFAAPDLIVTNAHVLAGASSASITTRGGSRFEGTVALVSVQRDLAFLHIPRQSALNVALPLGRSADVRLGQGVVALGWAESMTQSTVTRGVVTGLRRDGERLLLQTDAVPNPGDSGGPLLDRFGRVVGVTTARADNGSAGFAIAIDETRPFFERMPPNSGAASAPQQQAEAPTPAPPPAPSAAGPSESDARRTIGLQHYEASLAALEMSAAELDSGWSNYKTSCKITSVPGGQSHERFNLYDPGSPLHRTATYCADALGQIEQRARAMNASMAAAAELARQSGVFAGELRTIRARHHLDYAGWDR